MKKIIFLLIMNHDFVLKIETKDINGGFSEVKTLDALYQN